MKKLIPLLIGLLAAGAAQAQASRTATITFAKPTQYVDGTPIAAAAVVTYHVYQGTRGSTKTRVGTITATATTISSGLQPGETCWQVTAVANGVESAMSNEGCRVFPFPATESVIITVT